MPVQLGAAVVVVVGAVVVVVVGACVVLVVVTAHLGSVDKLSQLCMDGDMYCFQNPLQSDLNTDSVQVPFSQQVPIGSHPPSH